MANNKTCFHCGKQYEICYLCDNRTRFSWREVCCSPECYTKYLESLNGDLDKVVEVVKQTKKTQKVIEE